MSLRPRPTLLLMLALLSAAGAAGAQGATSDRDQPIQVEADRMSYDDARQTNVFTGRVLLTRGSVTIRADRMVLRQDDKGVQYATATGSPASFRQRRPGDESVEGFAQTLEYDTASETVRLRDKASMRRLEGERIVNEVFGNLIVYESRTEHFTVERGDSGSATAANPSGRVRVVIQPKSSGASAGASKSAPAPALVPSDRLKLPAPAKPSR